MRLSLARSAAVSLALCAMVLRALLPDGWMPAAAGFVICSVDGMHSGGKVPGDPARQRTHAPCAFAAAAPLAPPQSAAPAVSLSGKGRTIAFSRRDERFDSHTRYRANAPRAPPSFF